MTVPNRPSFFIVGHSKSGTTALSKFLEQHPDIFITTPSEPNFFCPTWCRRTGPDSAFVERTEAEYLALFEAAGSSQQCGEASAAYLYSPESAELIEAFDSDAKIIMVFREPVSFLRSYHLQLLRNVPSEGETVRDLREALELEPARRVGRELPRGCHIPEMLYYSSDRLRYAEHYDRYAARFPAEQILALTYDDFRIDNAGTIRRVFEFLGVDATVEPRLEDHNVGGGALRSRRAASLLRRATHGGRLAGAARGLVPRGLRRRLIRTAYDRIAFEDPPPLNGALIEEIQRQARPHVAALGNRLDRDLLREWDYSARDRAATRKR